MYRFAINIYHAPTSNMHLQSTNTSAYGYAYFVIVFWRVYGKLHSPLLLFSLKLLLFLLLALASAAATKAAAELFKIGSIVQRKTIKIK